MIEKAKGSSTFCIYPFSHLATKTDGTFKLCCRSDSVGNIRKATLAEVWNGEKVKTVRRKMLNNERPQECETCWLMEDVGARSMRQRALINGGEQSRWNLFSPMLSSCAEDGTMGQLPRSLELKISNLCNLKCRMCSPIDSVLWAKEWPEIAELMKVHDAGTYRSAEAHNVMKNPTLSYFDESPGWWHDFEASIDHLQIVEFAGGEPLIDPIHYKMLSMLERRAENIHLKYSTNLTNLSYRGRHITEFWKNYASVEVYASVDGIYDVYDYIRSGGKFSVVDNNLDTLALSQNFVLEELAVACTVQIYNAFQLPQMIEHFMAKNIKFHTHHVTFPNFLNVQVLPKHIKDKLTKEVEGWMSKEPKNEKEEYYLQRAKIHLKDFVHFMNGRDEEHLLPSFREFTRRMDKIRNTNAKKLSPDLAKILSEEANYISISGVR